ncbi:hypothetical protein ID866_8972 [Astraeus odoratus]|nr:hypothetical protein ID866_8972 [Astraeus odoratus]
MVFDQLPSLQMASGLCQDQMTRPSKFGMHILVLRYRIPLKDMLVMEFLKGGIW